MWVGGWVGARGMVSGCSWVVVGSEERWAGSAGLCCGFVLGPLLFSLWARGVMEGGGAFMCVPPRVLSCSQGLGCLVSSVVF